MKSLVNFVIQPNPASIGDVVSSMSLPYKQKPISNRSVSREAKPRRFDPVRFACCEDRIPSCFREVVRYIDLVSASAGIACCRDQHGAHALHLGILGGIVRHRSNILAEQALERIRGLWTLHGQQAHVVADIRQLSVEGVVLLDPVPVLGHVAGVHHEYIVPVVPVLHAINEQVVHDTTLAVGHAAILHLTYLQFTGVVARDVLDEVQSLRTTHEEFAHVAHIEHAHAIAHGLVLIDHASVLHRHEVACEGYHLGAKLLRGRG
jgi:hypothetical protein